MHPGYTSSLPPGIVPCPKVTVPAQVVQFVIVRCCFTPEGYHREPVKHDGCLSSFTLHLRGEGDVYRKPMCPLWVKSRHVQCNEECSLRAAGGCFLALQFSIIDENETNGFVFSRCVFVRRRRRPWQKATQLLQA